nr:putative capsid [Linepithema humile polycipivirus 2]
MNNTENELAPMQNLQIGEASSTLPEQAQQKERCVFRPMTLVSLMFQWQPTGFRVNVNLPFIGNDSGMFFCIRNGPYIPNFRDQYVYNGYQCGIFVYNNTKNVFLHFDNTSRPSDGPPKYPEGYKISLAHYDMPPPLARLAACFRKWSGGMQYRIRVVAGFATQGYLLTFPIKNTSMPVGIFDEYNSTPLLPRQDLTYKESMINSYIPSDTSMYRHVDITMPYEYPTPYYDQYNWLDQRCFPKVDGVVLSQNRVIIEPHGDNYIGVGVRGNLEASQDVGNISFEIEYRAMEDFQFSDPGLPPTSLNAPTWLLNYDTEDTAGTKGNQRLRSKTIPNRDYSSNGINTIGKGQSSIAAQPLAARIMSLVTQKTERPPPTDFGFTNTTPTHSREGLPLYSQCIVDRRTGELYTQCQVRATGEWKQFKGDKRDQLTRQGKYSPETRTRRDESDEEILNGLPLPTYSSRELEFS